MHLTAATRAALDALPQTIRHIGVDGGHYHVGVGAVHREGDTYTAAEEEFAAALAYYRQRHGRPFPACCEVLAVLMALGYRREG